MLDEVPALRAEGPIRELGGLDPEDASTREVGAPSGIEIPDRIEEGGTCAQGLGGAWGKVVFEGKRGALVEVRGAWDVGDLIIPDI